MDANRPRTMSFHHLNSTQKQSWDWCVDGGGEDWLSPPLLPRSDLEEVRQDLGQHTMYSGSETLCQYMVDGLYPYLDDHVYHNETQAPGMVGHPFESHHCTPWRPGMGMWSETVSSEFPLSPGNSQGVQQLRDPCAGCQYTHAGQPWPTSNDGDAAAFPMLREMSGVHPPLPEVGRNTLHPTGAKPALDAACSIQCPHGCGTRLTGAHALGNLTRHLKSRACAGSGRARSKHHCPIEGCQRVYSRTDGLKVHMRRRHSTTPTSHGSASSPSEGVAFSPAPR